jgi:hypothetical protein
MPALRVFGLREQAVSESAVAKGRPAEAAGARPASQATQLETQAVAQISGALRLVSADAEAALERFSDPQLIAAGRINLISLEAVQQRFADRWQMRKDQVFDFAERVLERGVGPGGFYLRVSDTDFFIVHPELGRLAGQAACLRYLREVLNHFLGDAVMAPAGVLHVSQISKGRLEAEPVDAVRADEAHASGDFGDDIEAVRLPAWKEGEALPPVRLNQWTPFVANDGRQLRISATLEPVYELKGFSRIGFRMIRRVIVVSTGEELTNQQAAALSAGDLLRADLATITRGIDRLKAESAGEKQLSLIVPISFSSLSSQRGRTELMTPLKEAGGLVKLGIICEILDIEGVPAGALLAATSLVRPFSLLVVGRLTEPSPRSVSRLGGAGLQALSFECPKNLGEAEFLGWAHAVIAPARKVARSVLVYGVGSPQRAGALGSLGASHVSLAAA